jgi:RNA-directed DNA polymerase
MATKLVIEPIFEADSHGFRPKRKVLDALGDVRKWLEAGVMEDGAIRETLAGTPQGGVISPLLANIYLNALDRWWQGRGRGGFVFLGCTFRKMRSILRMPRLHFMQRWPSPRAMKRIRDRVHDLTDARRSGAKDVMEIIALLNPVLRGWANYFRSGNADTRFNQLDRYVHGRITRWLWRRGGQRVRFRASKWPHTRLVAMGLYQMRTRVRYPAQATPIRSSVSRVRETRTHGLKGGPVPSPMSLAPQG